jgi:hypothetical protein
MSTAAENLLEQLYDMVGPYVSDPAVPTAEITAFINKILPELDRESLGKVDSLLDQIGRSKEYEGVRASITARRKEALGEDAGEIIDRQTTDPSSITPEDLETLQQAAEAGSKPISQSSDPKWVLDRNGRYLTNEERDRILEYVNMDTGADFQSYEEVVSSGYLDTPTEKNQRIVEGATLDVEPVSTFSVQLSGKRGDLFTVNADEFGSAQATYGVDAKELTAIVRFANDTDMRGADGEYIAWQPLAALLAATGLLDSNRTKRDTRISNQMQTHGPGSNSMGMPNNDLQFTGDYETPGSSMVDMGGFAPNPDAIVSTSSLGVRDIAAKFNKGIELYNGDPGMAYLFVLDEGLTGRISNAGFDGGYISGQDEMLIQRYAANGGFKSSADWRQSMSDQGYSEANTTGTDMVGRYLQRAEAERAGREEDDSGGGATRVSPDPVQVEQQAKALYRSMFLEDPDEATLSSFSSKITAMISGAPDDQDVDVTSRLRALTEELPEYEKYYGNKPAGMDEMEYQSQFGEAQRSMLGGEKAGDGGVRAGMQSGKYQTAVGAAANSDEAWDNSTYLGKLARAAQVVSRNT